MNPGKEPTISGNRVSPAVRIALSLLFLAGCTSVSVPPPPTPAPQTSDERQQAAPTAENNDASVPTDDVWASLRATAWEDLDTIPDPEVKAASVNNKAYRLFLESDDKEALRKAVDWIERVVLPQKPNQVWPAYIDTYAMLLYKLGRVEEAIMWEEKALAFATERKDDGIAAALRENLAKMKKECRASSAPRAPGAAAGC